MPLINLIQEQRLTVKKNEKVTRLFFMAFAGTGVLSVMTLGGLLFMTESASSEESTLRAKAQEVQPLLDQIQATNTDYGKLAPRLKTLEDAQEATTRWNRVLEHMSSQTPSETWLTQMRATQGDPKSPITVSFMGMSSRQELIGEFILRLQQLPDLLNVALKYSQEKNAQYGRQLEFEVSADLDGTIEEKERNETKKEGA